MKKSLLSLTTFFVILITTVQIQAQFGMKLGANYSTTLDYFKSDDGESFGLRPGFQGGVFYNLNTVEKATLRIELNFEKRGSISKKEYIQTIPVAPSSGFSGETYIERKIKSYHNYINLPIIVVIGKKKLKYCFGPSIGFLISAKAKFQEKQGTPTYRNFQYDDIDLKDYESFRQIFKFQVPEENGNFLNGLDFGINFGAMYQASENLFLEFRWYEGLAEITNNHYQTYLSSEKGKDLNLSIQIGAGYLF